MGCWLFGPRSLTSRSIRRKSSKEDMFMAAQHWRHLWTNISDNTDFTFWWGAVAHNSYVVITVSEAETSAQVPDRFIGAAKLTVRSIAPKDGFVWFNIATGWGSPL